ncbi:MAG: hypothetical protein KC445_09225 [Anaerolineales bacterium]|nr:hypothetical protein [Anaerolineales bacterium]
MKQNQIPTRQDDFRQIKGIGPVTKERLHAAEIHTFAQLTAVSPQDLANVLSGITAERIQQEDWHGQAKVLHGQTDATGFDNGQRYATFTVELLLDADNTVRRTRVVHVQDEDRKTSWSGWQPKALKQFIAKHAGLTQQRVNGTQVKKEPTPTAVSPPAKPARRTAIDELTMRFIQPPQPGYAATAVSTTTPPADEEAPTGQPLSVTLDSPHVLLEHGHTFNVQVHLDLEKLTYDKHTPLNYQAAIYAARLGSAARQKVGTAYGAINTQARQVAITVPTQIGSPGTYRLEAEMAVAWIPTIPDVTASTKGGLLHIY